MGDGGYIVSYYDCNSDGSVDLEYHELPNSGDLDRALSDADFDGRYDLRLRYGITVGYDKVDGPVPRGVRIQRGKPPTSITDEPPAL